MFLWQSGIYKFYAMCAPHGMVCYIGFLYIPQSQPFDGIGALGTSDRCPLRRGVWSPRRPNPGATPALKETQSTGPTVPSDIFVILCSNLIPTCAQTLFDGSLYKTCHEMTEIHENQRTSKYCRTNVLRNFINLPVRLICLLELLFVFVYKFSLVFQSECIFQHDKCL